MGLLEYLEEERVSSEVNIWDGYEPEPYQKRFHDSPAQIRTLVCGRRAGKSEMLVYELKRMAWEDSGFYQVVSPRFSQNRATHDKFIHSCRKHFKKVIYKTKVNPYRVLLQNGSEILWGSSDDPDSLRSEGPKAYCLDEFRFMKEQATWDVIYPALADYGARVIIATTCMGMNNMTYKLWKKGLDGKDPDYWSLGYAPGPVEVDVVDKHGARTKGEIFVPYWHGVPQWFNTHLGDPDPFKKKENMTELAFWEEVVGCFIPDMGQAIPIREDHFTDRVSWLDGPVEGERYYLGVDLGKQEDYTVVHVIRDTGKVARVYRWRDGWGSTIARLAELGEHWNRSLMGVDATGVGDPVFEKLVENRVNCYPIRFTDNKTKNGIIERMSIGVENRVIEYPDFGNNPALLRTVFDELEAYTYRTTDSGVRVYNAPDGQHDDCCTSLGIAYHLVTKGHVYGFASKWRDGDSSFI